MGSNFHATAMALATVMATVSDRIEAAEVAPGPEEKRDIAKTHGMTGAETERMVVVLVNDKIHDAIMSTGGVA